VARASARACVAAGVPIAHALTREGSAVGRRPGLGLAGSPRGGWGGRAARVSGVRCSGAGCLLWSDLCCGFDGEPTGEADLSGLRHGPISVRVWLDQIPIVEGALPCIDGALRDVEAVELVAVVVDGQGEAPAWPCGGGRPWPVQDSRRVAATWRVAEVAVFGEVGEVAKEGEVGVVVDGVLDGCFGDADGRRGVFQVVFEVVRVHVERSESAPGGLDGVAAPGSDHGREQFCCFVLDVLPSAFPVLPLVARVVGWWDPRDQGEVNAWGCSDRDCGFGAVGAR